MYFNYLTLSKNYVFFSTNKSDFQNLLVQQAVKVVRNFPHAATGSIFTGGV
jgi:hypothetical protein